MIDYFSQARPAAVPQAYPELSEWERETLEMRGILDLIAQGQKKLERRDRQSPDIEREDGEKSHVEYFEQIAGSRRRAGAGRSCGRGRRARIVESVNCERTEYT